MWFQNLQNQENEKSDLTIFQGLVVTQSMNFISRNEIDTLEKESDNGETQFCLKLNFPVGTNKKFEGACVDSGAQLSCIRKLKAMLYCKEIGVEFISFIFSQKYRFGIEIYIGLGYIHTHLPVAVTFFFARKVKSCGGACTVSTRFTCSDSVQCFA